jgi:hypothetical protein
MVPHLPPWNPVEFGQGIGLAPKKRIVTLMKRLKSLRPVKCHQLCFQKRRGHLSSSSNLQNGSDDESMDELKHIWASAKLRIDCESSDDE